ncbi:MAG: BON domain-containing protein [Pseudomonadota bacterium]
MNSLPHRFTLAAALAAFVLLVPLSGCNQSKDTTGTAASTTIGNEIDDSVVTTKVKSVLLADNFIKSLEIKVETRKGEVMLSGFADNQAQIERAVFVSKTIPGVKNVVNKLILKEGKQTVGNKIDDTVITTGVKTAMLQDPLMKSMEVSVVTRKGEVQLSGFVDSDLQYNHAVEVAKGVEGVTSVVNSMQVKK